MFGSTSIAARQVSEGRQELDLDGEVTVFSAAQLHQEAVRLADSGHDVHVSCEHLSELDASTLQVLVALRVTLIRQGKIFQLSGLSDELQDTIRLAGLAEPLGLFAKVSESEPQANAEPIAATETLHPTISHP